MLIFRGVSLENLWFAWKGCIAWRQNWEFKWRPFLCLSTLMFVDSLGIWHEICTFPWLKPQQKPWGILEPETHPPKRKCRQHHQQTIGPWFFGNSNNPEKTLAENQEKALTRWWQLKYLLCSPRKLGKMNPIWLSHIFQMGWWKTTKQLSCCYNFQSRLWRNPKCFIIPGNVAGNQSARGHGFLDWRLHEYVPAISGWPAPDRSHWRGQPGLSRCPCQKWQGMGWHENLPPWGWMIRFFLIKCDGKKIMNYERYVYYV